MSRCRPNSRTRAAWCLTLGVILVAAQAGEAAAPPPLTVEQKKKRLRERETDLEEARFHEERSGDIDPDLRSRVQAAIDALPDGLRMALVMHSLEGYTHAEVAGALGIAEGTSKARVFEARAKLRVQLGDFLEDMK